MALCAVAVGAFWELNLEEPGTQAMRRSASDFCLNYHSSQEPAESSLRKKSVASSQRWAETFDSSPCRWAEEVEESECSFRAASSSASTTGSSDDRSRRVVRLGECLEHLDAYEATCILRVTRLLRVGSSAMGQLKDYLQSNFGVVERVLEVHPKHLSRNNKVSNMVYIVMQDSEAAARVLSFGNEHQLPGGSVLVRDFQRKR